MSKQTPNQMDLESIKAIHNELETLENNFQNASNSTQKTLDQHQKQIQSLKQAIDKLNSEQTKTPINNSDITSKDSQISLSKLNEKVNQLLQNQSKILSLENSVRSLSKEILLLKGNKSSTEKNYQQSDIESLDDITQIKNELIELKEQMAIRPTLRLVERSIQNEIERQQNISSFERQNLNDSEISSIKHEIQLLKQQIQSNQSISQIKDLQNHAKELKEKLQSKSKQDTMHPDQFYQQMREELTFLEENFIEAYNFNTLSLVSQAKQIKQLRHIIMSPYDFDDSEENSNEDIDDEENSNVRRGNTDSNTKKLKNIVQNLQESVRKQAEADHAVLRCIKHEIKKLKSQETLGSIENSIEQLRNKISQVEEDENDKIEDLQDQLENTQNKLRKLKLFNGKDINDEDLDNSTFFDGSVDSLRAHLKKLDNDVKEFRLQLQKSKTDSEDIEKSITNIVNCLKHEMKKVRNNQTALTDHLKEKGIVSSDLDLEASSGMSLSSDQGIDVKSRNIALPFEQVTSENAPEGYYKIQLPDEPFDEIKKELYTLECNFIQTANIHATSIEDHYKQLEEIRKNLQERKNAENSLNESSENKSEIIRSLKSEVQKLKQNGALSEQQMRGIEDMNNRITAIEDYLQEEPEIVEIHPLDENGNSIHETDPSQETLIRPIIETIKSMAEEIRLVKDNCDCRDSIQCIEHELKKQSAELTKTQPYFKSQISVINHRLDTIETYLVNETEEEEIKERNQSVNLELILKNMTDEFNKQIIPLKEKIDALEQERRRSSNQSKRDIDKLKQALKAMEQKTPQETLDAIQDIMDKIDETISKQDADRSTIRCLKHEMIKLKGPLEKAGKHNEEIDEINNRLNTIEEYLQEDEPIIDIENDEEEEEEFEEDPTIQIGNVVAQLIESMKSMKDEMDEVRDTLSIKNNTAIRCIKHELKKLKCQIELQELLDMNDSEGNVQLPDDYEERIQRLRKELHTLEDKMVDTTNNVQTSIGVNSLEIEKLKKRYAELEVMKKELEEENGLTIKQRIQFLEHSNRCLKYEVKKLIYQTEMQNIINEDMMSSSMNLSADEGDSMSLSPEAEIKISKIKEELRTLEKNFEETSNLHTNSLDIHELQLHKLRQLINETDDKIGGKSLVEIENRFNRQLSNIENLFNERLKKTNLNVHVVEKQIENVYENHGLIPYYPENYDSVFTDEDNGIRDNFSTGYHKIPPSKVGGNKFLFTDKNLDNLYSAVNEIRGKILASMNEEGIILIPDFEKGPVVELVSSIERLEKKNKLLEKSLSQLTDEFNNFVANADRKVLNLGIFYTDTENEEEEVNVRSPKNEADQLEQLQNEIAQLREIIQNRDSNENSAVNLQLLANDVEDEGSYAQIADEIKSDVSNIKKDVDNQIEELKSKIANLSQQIVESPVVTEREYRLDINKNDWSENSFDQSSEDFEIIRRDNQEMRENIDDLNQQIQIIRDSFAQYQQMQEENKDKITLKIDATASSDSNIEPSFVDDFQAELQEIKENYSKLGHDYKCLKYEVKKLKNDLRIKVRNAELSEIVHIEEPNSEIISNIDEIKEEFDEKIGLHDKDLESLKSEINKLKITIKSNDPSGMVFNLANTNNFDFDDLVDRVEDYKSKADEDNHALLDKIAKLETGLKNLNRNVKSLDAKCSEERTFYTIPVDEDQREREIEEIVSISTENLEKEIKSMKVEMNMISDQLKTILENEEEKNKQVETFDLNSSKDDLYEQENNEIKHSLKCLKYEVKRLKDKIKDLQQIKEPTNQPIKEQINPVFERDIILEEEEEDTSDRGIKEDLNKVPNNLQHSLNCLKFEVKKLKSKVNDTNDIKDQINESNEDLRNAIECLKHEIKLLKLETPNDDKSFILDDRSLSFIQPETQNKDLKCIKYEIKKLKSNHQNSNDAINHKIGCLKYEIKKLKSKSQFIDNEKSFIIDQNNGEEEEVSENINHKIGSLKYEIKRLSDVIDKLTDKTDELNKDVDDLKSNQNQPENKSFIIDNQNVTEGGDETVNHKIGCLKYEVKKLKEMMTDLTNRMNNDKNKLKSDPAEPAERSFIIDQGNNEEEEGNENINNKVGCLKYEVKKLKEIIKNLTDKTDNLNNDMNDLKSNQGQNQPVEMSFVIDQNNQEGNEELNHKIGCLKHEVKKLKDFISKSNKPEIDEELLRNIQDIESSMKKLILTVDQMKIELDELKDKNESFQLFTNQGIEEEEVKKLITKETEPINNSIGCLKYEVKRLKESLKDSNEPEVVARDVFNLNSQNIINDELKEEVDELKSVVTKLNDESRVTFKCLKYEIKRLKSLNSELKENQDELIKERNTFQIGNVNQIEIENEIYSLKENEEKILDDLKCLKYEMKRLIENNKQDVFDLTNPNLDNDNEESLKCLKYEVKKLKETVSKLNEQMSNQQEQQTIEKSAFVLDDSTDKDETINKLKRDVKLLKETVNKMIIRLNKMKSNNQQNNSFDIENQLNADDVNKLISEKADPINHSMKCVKYEVKHLKESLKDANHNINKLKYFYKQMNSNPLSYSAGASPTKESFMSDDKLYQTVKALKYEVRKLKSLHENKADISNDDIEDMKKSIRCLKYEVKQLKFGNKEEEEKVHQNIKALKYAVKNLKEKANESGTRGEEFRIDDADDNANYDDLKRSIVCLKYEVKKLKKQNEDDEKLRLTVKALKYEVRKLKENNNNNTDEFQLSRSVDLNNDDFKKSLRCLKYEVKQLKNKNEEVEGLSKSFESLKYEVRKLKEKQDKEDNNKTDEFQLSKSVDLNNDDFKKSLRCLKYEVKQLKNKNEELQESIKSLKYEENNNKTDEFQLSRSVDLNNNDDDLKRSLRCLKYEVKHLKDKNEELEGLLQSVKLMKNEIRKLKELVDSLKDNKADIYQLHPTDEIDELRELISSMNFDDIRRSICCLKYEVKKLKNNAPVRDKDQFSLEVDLDDISSDAEIVISPMETVNVLTSSIHCLKYEVKKLKDQMSKFTSDFQNKGFVLQLEDSSDQSLNESEVQKMIDEAGDRLLSPVLYDIEKIKKSMEDIKNNINVSSDNQFINLNETDLDELRQMIMENKDDVDHKVGCIKYEVKKLKDALKNPNNENVQPDLRYDELVNDINLLKEEINELKDRPIPENVIPQSVDQEDLTLIKRKINKLTDDMKCVKFEVKRMKNNQIENMYGSEMDDDILLQLNKIENRSNKSLSMSVENSDEIKSIQEQNKEMNEKLIRLIENIRCIKFEVKKLKSGQSQEVSSTSEIPSDLLKRLSAAENAANSALRETDSLREEGTKMKNDIGCLKYEVKKLRDRPVPSVAPIARSVPVPTDTPNPPSDILDRLSEIEEVSIEAQNKANEAKVETQTLVSKLNNFVRDVNCLKYEVKKLKGRPIPIPKQDSKSEEDKEDPIISSDLLDRLSEIENECREATETSNNAMNETKTIRTNLKCIKYELRKLIDRPIPENPQVSPSEVPSDLLERLSQAEDSYKEAIEQAQLDQSKLKRLIEDMKCVKYELKKMKQSESNPIEYKKEEPSIPSDLLDRLSKVEDKCSEATETSNDAMNETKTIRTNLKCIKYELRKLIDRPIPENQQTSPSEVPSDLLERLSQAEQQIDDLNDERQNLKKELRCIKYELKKLKETPIEQPKEVAISPIVLKRLAIAENNAASARMETSELMQEKEKLNNEIAALRKEVETMKNNVGCLKYEVKKLKDQPTPVPAPIEEDPSSSDINERLSDLENRCTLADNKAEEAKIEAQTVLDKFGAMVADVRCIKYEVKKLKERPIPEPTTREIPIERTESPGIEERLLNVEKKCEEANDKADKSKEESEEAKRETERLGQEFNKLNHDLNCLKYEIKKLKKRPTPEATERSPETPAIPSDLLERLSELENKCREAAEKAEESKDESETAIEASNKTKEEIERIDNDFNKLNHDLNCMKYEIKKLKKRPTPEESQPQPATETPTIPSDLLERLSELENKCGEANDKSEEAKSETERLGQEFNKLNHDLNCMKYEIKKLKKRPTPESTERSPATATIPSDLLERLSSAEETAKSALKATETLEEEGNKMKNDIGCLKHEVKKLKERPTPAVAPISTIINEPTTREAEIEPEESAITNQSEMLEDISSTKQSIEDIHSEINRLIEDLKCIKYEIKKLKERPIREASQPQPQPATSVKSAEAATNPSDILDQLSETQQETRDNRAEINRLIEDLKCMKYEIKKLKERPIPEVTQPQPATETSPTERSPATATIPSDLLERLSSAEETAKSALKAAETLEEEGNKMKNDIGCLKHEVKKLKERPTPAVAPISTIINEPTTREAEIEEEESEDISSTKQSIEDIHSEINRLIEDLKCIKYEVKKLKEQPIPEASQPQPSLTTEIPPDLLERLSTVENASKEANDKSEEAKESAEKNQKDISKLIEDLRCMKYEMKKLKERPTPEATERSPETPAIPSDLLERLSELENKCREAAEKAESSSNKSHEAIEKSESATEEVYKMRQNFKKLIDDLKCIKYEVKKLKERPIPETASPTEKSSEAPTIPSDLLDRLSRLENKCREATEKAESSSNKSEEAIDKSESATETSTEAKSETERLGQEFKKLNHDLNCMKYEIKKLKRRPTPEATEKLQPAAEVTERSPETATIPSDLLERLSSAEETAKSALKTAETLEEEGNKMKNDIGCLKHEVKKLKERPTAAVAPIQETAPPTRRSVDTPTIPSDLLERLSRLENKCREATEKAESSSNKSEEAIEKSESATEEVATMRQNFKKLIDDLKCIKYEVKKLKERPIPETASPTEKSSEAPTIPSDLLDRLSRLENKCREATEKAESSSNKSEEAIDKSESATETSTEAKSETERLGQEFKKLNHDLNCMKYEIKKLKRRPTPEASQPQPATEAAPIERSPETATIPSDLLERLSSAEETAKSALKAAETLEEERNKMKNDIGCLKHEVKKLKERPIPEVPQPQPQPATSVKSAEAATIPSDILDQLSETQQETQDNHALKYMKYEVKKLKERPIPEVTQPQPQPATETSPTERSPATATIPSDLLERLSELENQCRETNDKSEEAKAETERISQEFNKLNHDLNCMKYEIKKLKKRPTPESTERSPETATIPSDLLERLSSAEESSKSALKAAETLEKEGNRMKNDIGCLKHEVKKLKERPTPEASQPRRATETATIPSDILDQLSETQQETRDNRAEINRLIEDLKCMKYEIKKLKERPIPEVTQPQPATETSPTERSPATATIPSDLLERLSSAEETAKSALKAAETLEEEGNKMKNDIGCLKHEVKKLKERPTAAVAPISTIINEPTTREAEIEPEESAITNQSEMLEDISSTKQSIEDIHSEINRLIEDLKCIKYEVKKLKERPIPEVTQPQPATETSPTERSPETATIPSDLLERLSSAEETAKSALKATETLEEEGNKMKNDIGCLKHEVKKLKERPTPAVAPISTIINEPTTREAEIEEEESEDISSTKQSIEDIHSEINRLIEDLKCIKYEVKKLKEQPIPEVPQPQPQPATSVKSAEAATIPSDILDQLSETQQETQDNHALKYMKYEVKKLKERPIPEVTQPQPQPATETSPTERSPATATIPSDLLERLSSAEETAKSALKAAETLEEERNKMKNDIGCLKHEVKKLKERPTPAVAPISTIINEPTTREAASPIAEPTTREIPIERTDSPGIAERLSNVEKKCEEANDKADKSKEESEEAKRETERLGQEFKKLNPDLNCMKYEIKKLKRRPEASQPQPATETSPTERSPETATIPSDLLERLSSAEETAKSALKTAETLEEEGNKMKNDIGCLKHEVKKLKERPTPETSQPRRATETATIPPDLLERLSTVENASKEANDKSEEAKTETERIDQEFKKLNHDLNCMKYEIKKLKGRPTPAQTQARDDNNSDSDSDSDNDDDAESSNSPQIPSDLLARLSRAESQSRESRTLSKEASENAVQATEQVKLIRDEFEKFSAILKCLKYEVRQLKHQQGQATARAAQIRDSESDSEEAATIPSDFASRLSSVENQARSDREQVRAVRSQCSKLAEDFRCVKYELKKLKERQTPAQRQTQEGSALETRQSDAEERTESISSEIEKLRRTVECVKYEVKRLKRQPLPTTTGVSNESDEEDNGPPKIASDLLSRLSAAENKSDEASSKSEEAKAEAIRTEFIKLTRELNCIKYEVKKLKGRPTPEAAVSRTTREISIERTESPGIEDRLSNLEKKCEEANDKAEEETKRIDGEFKRLNNNLNCIKYEIKKLKGRPTPEAATNAVSIEQSAGSNNFDKEEIVAIRNEFSKLNEDFRCVKYELKKLKERQTPAQTQEGSELGTRQSDAEERTESISSEIEKLRRTVECVKYEVKRLKRQPLPTTTGVSNESDEEDNGSPKIASDLLSRLSAAERQSKEAKEESASIHNEFDKFVKILKCLKYEVRLLKQRHESEEASESSAEVLSRLSEAENEAKSRADQIESSFNEQIKALRYDREMIKEDIKCIKYEVKKLKERK